MHDEEVTHLIMLLTNLFDEMGLFVGVFYEVYV